MVETLKKNWNIVLALAGLLVASILDFVVPPKFESNFAESNINYEVFSKFIVAGCITLLIVAFYTFRKKKHTASWAIVSLLLLAGALYLQNQYYDLYDRKVVYVKDKDTLFVIGETYKKEAQDAKKAHPNSDLSPEDLIDGLDNPYKVWPKDEIIHNSRDLIYLFIPTVVLYSLFALCAVQSLYCVTRREEKPRRGN